MAGPIQRTHGLVTPSDVPPANDSALRKEMIAKFIEESPKQLARLRTALTSLDGASLKAAAHSLRSQIGIFNDQAASDAALCLEHIGRDGEWSRAEDAWTVLCREFTRLSDVLAAARENLTDPASASPQSR